MLTRFGKRFWAPEAGGGSRHVPPPPPLAAEPEKPAEPAATDDKGAAAEEPAAGEPEKPAEPPKPAADNLVHLTTEQLNKRLGQAKRVERENLLKELELPLDSNIAEIKEALADHKRAKDAEKTEIEKAKAREAELEERAAAAEARALENEKALFLERHVRTTGWVMRPEFFEVELRLWAEQQEMDPEDELDGDTMKRFADETKAAHPEYFGQAPKVSTTGGDGGAPGKGKGKTELPFNALTATQAERDAYNRKKYGRTF